MKLIAMPKLIKNIYLSEKAQAMAPQGKYVALVDFKANKSELKKELKKDYKVDALGINIIITGKNKKAIFTLKEGQTLEAIKTEEKKK